MKKYTYIAEGREGKVYRVTDKNFIFKTEYAVKVINLNKHNNANIINLTKNHIEWNKLFHDKIVKLFDTSIRKNKLLITMEYCKFGTLRDKLFNLSETEAIQVMIQTLEALEYCHSKKIVHGDISPQNILFTNKLKIKITDFGSASIGELNENTPFSGNPNYLAPEKAWLSKYDHRADIFSVAAILYEYLAKKPIFESQYESAYFDNEKLETKLKEITITSTAKLKKILRKSLSPSPKFRTTCATEFKRELLEILSI